MHFIKSAHFAGAVAILLTSSLIAAYFVFEPQVSRAVDSVSFNITQTIDGAISFLVQPQDVTMVGSIDGLNGGNATGTTYAVVRSNSATGYTLDIKFSTSGPAMRGNTTGNTGIRDYGDGASSTAPTYGFTASSAALFGYSATSSAGIIMAQQFRDNGALCDQSGGTANGNCWAGALDNSPTNYRRLVNHNASVPTGATTTLIFKVNVPSNPLPSLEADTYTATATLTALNQ